MRLNAPQRRFGDPLSASNFHQHPTVLFNIGTMGEE
jgi:hypothetical protein